MVCFYGWFTVGWCVCRGWCVRVSHVFGVGSPKVRDVTRHTSPFSGGWWFVFMVGLRLVGVFVVAGVFVSLTSLELVARRCVMLCDTPRLLVVVGGFYCWFTVGWCVCRGWCVRVSHVFGVGSPKVRDVTLHVDLGVYFSCFVLSCPMFTIVHWVRALSSVGMYKWKSKLLLVTLARTALGLTALSCERQSESGGKAGH